MLFYRSFGLTQKNQKVKTQQSLSDTRQASTRIANAPPAPACRQRQGCVRPPHSFSNLLFGGCFFNSLGYASLLQIEFQSFYQSEKTVY
jgi:hypothetical protein